MLYSLTTIILLLNLTLNATEIVDDGLLYIRYFDEDYLNYNVGGLFVPRYKTKGIIYLYNQSNRDVEEYNLLHELKHLYCWRNNHTILHGECFKNANIWK